MVRVSRRRFLEAAAAGALVGCALTVAGSAGRTRPPNVLIIMTDDQGYGDFACLGNPDLRTKRKCSVRSREVIHIIRLAA